MKRLTLYLGGLAPADAGRGAANADNGRLDVVNRLAEQRQLDVGAQPRKSLAPVARGLLVRCFDLGLVPPMHCRPPAQSAFRPSSCGVGSPGFAPLRILSTYVAARRAIIFACDLV